MDHDASKSFSPSLRIMLADDHSLLRQGVRALPELNGLDVIREIRRILPQTKSLLLTMHTDDAFVLEGR
jgi:response regulator RpfG family c-di-GMP phosphodiesterase